MAEKDEVISFKVEAKIDAALKQMAQYDRNMRKFQQTILKSSQKMGKEGMKVAEGLQDANEDLIDTMDDLDDAYDRVVKAQQKSASGSDREVNELQKATKALEAKTKALKEYQDSLKSEYQKALEDPKAAKKMSMTIRKEFIGSLRGGFKSFLAKDAKGLASDFGELLKGSVKFGGLKVGAAGAALSKRGKDMKAEATARGGGANGMKAMASMMGGVGKALEGISKAAPLIAGLSTILVKIVSLFLDAQAQAKQFNKDILQSASTVEFYGQSFGNAAMAGYELRETLDDIRDAAYDAQTNLDWGITADTHKAVLNTLTQEGISLRSIATEAQRAGKTTKDFAKELVTTSVAYSRLLGVPLQEINQLQAEMITDLGMGIQQTDQAFGQMTRAAADSGIAANKFFAIIRGVSQDLSLWGSRMEDAVKLLGKLGKVMNPREAAKFMNTAMAGLKNMGRAERLRVGLLTGEKKFGKLIERDTKRKAEGLAKQLGVAVEDLADPKKLNDAIERLPEEQKGAARSAAIEMKEQMTAAGKGIFGKAIAGRTMGPAASLEVMKSALARFGGGKKKLGEMRGDIGPEMMAENLGISEEQLDQMVKFETSIDMTRDALIKTLQTGTDEEKKIARMQIKKAGIQGETEAELIKNVNEAGYDQIMDTLDDNAKKELAEGEKDPMKDFAQKQTSLQQSLMDKLTVYVDFFMNQFYDAITGIWDAIMSIPGIGKGGAQRAVQKKVFSAKDEAISKMWAESAEDIGKFKSTMIGAGGIGASLGKAIEQFKSGKTDEEKEAAKWNLDAVARSIQTAMAIESDKGVSSAQDALKAAGLTAGDNAAKAKQVQEFMEAGDTFTAAMRKAEFSQDDMMAAMQKAVWTIPADALVDLRKTLEMKGALVTQPTGPAPSGPAEPSAQAKASAKAQTPGMPAPTVMPPPTQAAPAPVAKAAAAPPPMMAAAPTPAAAPAGAGAVMPAVPQEVKDYQEANLDWLGTLGGKNDDIIQILKRKVKLDKSFVRDELGPQIEDSVLKAVRVALVEYKLYKDVDMETFQTQLTTGTFDPKTYGKDLMDAVEQGTADITGGGATLPTKGTGNALGGHIIGQNPDGTAKVLRPPAGEMPAFVGPGETIAPRAGGRGAGGDGGVSVTVNGIGGNDLAQMVKVAATNAIYEYKRREGLH